MAKKQPIKYELHRVEEKHRGKWQQLMDENGKPRMVKITEQTAEAMNVDQDKQGIKYVKMTSAEAKEAQKIIDARAGVEEEEEEKDERPSSEQVKKYKELYGKKPFTGWNASEVEEKIKTKEAEAEK